MTRERAKELLPIIQAFLDGKIIQTCGHAGIWFDVDTENFTLSMLDVVTAIRIKPKKKYRPFATAEEFKPHRDRWVRHKESPYRTYRIISVQDTPDGLRVTITMSGSEKEIRLHESFVFDDDGTPCGVEVEE